MSRQESNRRYDIDWLRVIAIGLLLIYHIAISFQPWGVFIQFIQNNESLTWLWTPMSMLNVWRIPLLFFVSGMGVRFAMKKRNLTQLIIERFKRIFIPFIFGAVIIVPVHVFIWQKYYGQDLVYSPGRGHLWFLANIFIYVILLSPLFFYLKSKLISKFIKMLQVLFANPFGLLLISLFFVLETILVKPEIYSLYALNFHGFAIGFIAFFFGFTFVLTGNAFWNTVLKWRWFYLSLSSILYIIRLVIFKLEAPNYLMAIESVVWIFSVLGFGYKYLNRSSKTLSYLSKAAYPVYIIHMVFMYISSLLIFPLNISAGTKFILTIATTFTGCFGFYEIIRRINFIRPLFGLKLSKIRLMNKDASRSRII